MRFQSLLPALLSLALLASFSSATAAATPAVHFLAQIGECALSGTAQDVAELTLKVRSASGMLKGTQVVPVVGGNWSIDCPGPRIRVGDQLRFFADGSTRIRTFRVPELRLATDRANDRISGVAPGVSSVALRLISCDVAFVACTARPPVSRPVDTQTHRFSYHAADDVKGGWMADLRWDKAGDTIHLIQRVAQLVVQPGSAIVRGTGRRTGQVAAVAVHRGDTIGLAAPHTRSDASFTALVKLHGSPVKVRKGDLVTSSIAPDAVLNVPETGIDLTVSGVEGWCFKNRPVTVLIHDAIGELQAWAPTTTDSTGHWAVPVTPMAGWTWDAYCANAHGDVLKLHLFAL